MAKSRRQFGSLRRLPSGRYQAAYTGPDTQRHKAPTTFDTKFDAEAWLTDVWRSISRGEWTPTPERQQARPTTFGAYAATWLTERTLKPRTRHDYGLLLERQIGPTFNEVPLAEITPQAVRTWYVGLGAATPTLNSRAYGLLRTILGQAVNDGEIATNPCRIRGASNVKRAHKIAPATLPELAALTNALPHRYRAMVLLASWCGLRYGEVTELRRADANLALGVLHIRRAVVRIGGRFEVGTPKSEAGVRDVAIPPHLLPALEEHLELNVGPAKDALLFPAADGQRHLAPSTFYKSYYAARDVAGRPDLRFHDLRHTGAVLAATTGATLAELMARLGHSTAGAAMRYQHAAQDRDRVIAEALSALAAPTPRD